jgi:hypothetical protein
LPAAIPAQTRSNPEHKKAATKSRLYDNQYVTPVQTEWWSFFTNFITSLMITIPASTSIAVIPYGPIEKGI